ncbi:TrmH family RNA methyltransferase [Isobaculum melis]|uniref:RNA methyltransferase, TrmH family n=1 Tax=Isobaculum melis TaxID=142588 RepID=A0A1H9RJW7_9LACT|nr:RNA methyltransferase [Isobaculum melis]SER72333.1 RNA methyltransferase, TrmH family [Isobaculum melis]
MEKITSLKNERVKNWKKLHTKKGREKEGYYLIEGFHLVEEAIKHEAAIHELIYVSGKKVPATWQHQVHHIFEIIPEIAKALADTEAEQGIFATIKLQSTQPQVNEKQSYLLLDAIQDPGNLGTMIRTADAAGLDGVVLGEGTVDLYNGKVLRSMQGSHFHLPIYRGNLSEWISLLKEKQVPVYGTELNEQAVLYDQIGKQSAFALIMGNEGNGVAKELLAQTDQNLYIPIKGQAESLNVAIAAGIILFTLKA